MGITTARSEKHDKQLNHRHDRRLVKQLLRKQPAPEVLPRRRELSNIWSMAKDGKQRISVAEQGSSAYRQYMRK